MTSPKGRTWPDSRPYLSAAVTWVRAQRPLLALLGAVLLAQLSRVLFEALRRDDVLTTGKPPLLGVFGLVSMLFWGGVIVWARYRIRKAVSASAQGWVFDLPQADAMPRRYVIENAGLLLARALCTILDLVVLLVMQNAIREPLLLVASAYTREAWADGVFAAVIVIIALFLLSNVYRTSKPVAAYLAWSGLDRLVPTAGFLAAGVVPALAQVSGSQAALPQPASKTETGSTSKTIRGTVAPARSAALAEKAELTVGSPSADELETIVAEPHNAAGGQGSEPTLWPPLPHQQETIVAEPHKPAGADQRD